VKSAEDDQRKSKHRSDSAEKAALTQSLSIFAKSVARDDVRDDAKAAIVEATAKTVLPVRHFEMD